MSSPVIIPKFGEDVPFTLDNVNQVIQSLVAAINSLSADPLLQYGVTPGVYANYMPVTGGQFTGQIAAPSVLIGPVDGAQYPAVHENQFATPSSPGILKQTAPYIADIGSFDFELPDITNIFITSADAPTISNPPTQGEVQAVATLANEIKADINNSLNWINNTLFVWLRDDLLAKVNNQITRENNAMAGLRAAGVMDEAP